MGWIRGLGEQPWRITLGAVGGLLITIIIAGLIGFWQTRNIESVADEAFSYVELEDEGDDIRAAVLDMRHYHRNLYFPAMTSGNLTQESIDQHEDAYGQLQTEIRELEAVGAYNADAPQPEEFRRRSEEYYSDFRPFVQPEITDQAAFAAANNRGLAQLGEMELAAEKLDGLGEDLTDDSLQAVDRAATTSEIVLLAAIVGLLLVGVGLAYSAVRVVNELRLLYAGQQETAEKLAEASRAKTDFLADVSHELRTPLTVLRGNAQVGLALGAEGEQAQLLREVVEESRHMSRMVEDLLFLSRSDSSSSPPLDLHELPVAPFISELAGRAEILAREQGAVLETDLRAEGELRADSARVGQAVLVLVDNAIKYGPLGGLVKLRSSTTGSGELRITVEDRGPGIPKEDLPRIFERFYRVDKARSRKMGGTGLGLPIARTIVEAHGGHITAESHPGRGTSMSIHLPLFSVSHEQYAPEDDLREGVTPASDSVRRAEN